MAQIQSSLPRLPLTIWYLAGLLQIYLKARLSLEHQRISNSHFFSHWLIVGGKPGAWWWKNVFPNLVPNYKLNDFVNSASVQRCRLLSQHREDALYQEAIIIISIIIIFIQNLEKYQKCNVRFGLKLSAYWYWISYDTYLKYLFDIHQKLLVETIDLEIETNWKKQENFRLRSR